MKALRFFLVLICTISLILTSCKGDEFSKKALCDALRSQYSAKADFIISDHNNNTMGSIEIQKGDTLRISFVSPSEYEGITVIGDETNAPDIISFEYSGIPASIPKSISGELSLLFSLFSDSIPAVIENLEKDAFTDNGDGTCQVFFFEKNISCRIIYDLSTGRVLLFEAGDDELSISLEMSDYKL